MFNNAAHWLAQVSRGRGARISFPVQLQRDQVAVLAGFTLAYATGGVLGASQHSVLVSSCISEPFPGPAPAPLTWALSSLQSYGLF
jgi:hypothetical protein